MAHVRHCSLDQNPAIVGLGPFHFISLIAKEYS